MRYSGNSLSRSILFLAAFLILTSFRAAPGAQEVRYYPVPRGAHPHDVAPAPDGTVWYTAQARASLGRLDPATGAVEAVPVCVDGRDAVWLTDFGANALVRFDQKTGYPSNRKDANVRRLLGLRGEIWGAESGNDRLVVVESR